MKWLQISLYVMLNFFVGGLCLLTYTAYQALPQIKEDYSHIKKDLNEVTEEWLKYNKNLSTLMNSPQTQRSIGLFMRTGDDVNSLVKKMDNTVNSLNQLIKNTDKNLNQVAIPNANSLISNTKKEMLTTFSNLQGPIKETERLLKSSTILVEDFNKNTTSLAESWIATSDTANKTIQSFESTKITTDQILRNVEYDTKRMGDILDVTYNKMVKVKNWVVRILMETGGWAYRVFIKP